MFEDKEMKVTQDKLEAFPPKSNPFNHDSYHMAQNFGKNHVLMFPNHASEELKYFILIDTSTGKRIRFTVDGDEASHQGEDVETPTSVRQSVRQSVARIVADMAGGGISAGPIEPDDAVEALKRDLEEVKFEDTEDEPTS